MRQGSWKLVRPAVNIAFADAEGQRLLERYVELDIEYKYHPENIQSIFTDMIPELALPTLPAPELYHIEDDPQERNNLATLHPERVRQMVSALDSWFEEVESERARIVV
ncbi:MAG: hypothetical protein HC802_02145 [Caldilineaceae bacterium]|nr:hypothetical protein [Caldilineaceae bacterium]